MNVIADTHTHSLVCSHAYSTIYENITYAKKMGHVAIVSTEHGPAMPGTTHDWYFFNDNAIPRIVDGIYFFFGIEANIINSNGDLDLQEQKLFNLDLVIASFHSPCYIPKDEKECTNALLKVVQNPNVDVLGHMGTPDFKCDYELVVAEAKKYGKVIEINNHSAVARHGSKPNCIEIAKLCKKYEVDIFISSDAHFFTDIGYYKDSFEIIKEAGVPENQILNIDKDRFLNYMRQKITKKPF